MIKVTVTRFDSRRIARIREALNAESSRDLLRLVPIFDFEDKALAYIQKITPRGEHSAARRSLGLGGKSYAERALADTWKSKLVYSGNRILFQIYSSLETVGGKRGEAKLTSIEYGNKKMLLKPASKMFSFLGDEHWVAVGKGQRLKRKARRGKKLLQKTSDYIQERLLPKVQARVEKTLRYRMESRLP